jgi:hypothetical protein
MTENNGNGNGKERDEKRGELLASINGLLDSLKLKRLPILGDHKKGEIEIVGLPEVFDHSLPFYYVLRFPTVNKDGSAGKFNMLSNCNSAVSDGNVLVVSLNSEFLIQALARTTLGEKTIETFRGFGDRFVEAQAQGTLSGLPLTDLPLGLIWRELGEVAFKKIERHAITYLGNPAQNSGTDMGRPKYWHVELFGNIDVTRFKANENLQALNMFVWSPEQVFDEIGGKINDNHSITAFSLFQARARRMRKLARV